jgi:hypothetical protein
MISSILENMHKKPLGFDCMHENKTFYFEMKAFLKTFWIFLKFQ